MLLNQNAEKFKLSSLEGCDFRYENIYKNLLREAKRAYITLYNHLTQFDTKSAKTKRSMFRPKAEEFIRKNFSGVLVEADVPLFTAFCQFGGFINNKYANIAVQDEERVADKKEILQ